MRTVRNKIRLQKKKHSVKKRGNINKSLFKKKHTFFLVKYSQKGGINCETRIGSGDYGEIFSCFINADKNSKLSPNKQLPFAVKKVLINEDNSAKKEFQNEINIMKLLKGEQFKDYILQLIELQDEKQQDTIYTNFFYSEYCDLGNLTDFYIKNNLYKKKDNPVILKHILTGLNYLYDNFIIHSDIRTDNIFVQEKNGKILYKIADFGKAYKIQQSTIDFMEIPYANVAVPKLLLYTTYFRDLYGWYLILLHLYGNINCHYFTGRDTVLYPINFSDKQINYIVILLYNLQTLLINNYYKGENKKVHNEILDETIIYELQGEPSCPIKKKSAKVSTNNSPPPPPPRPSKPALTPPNNNSPPPPPPRQILGNRGTDNININSDLDRSFYEPIYAKLKTELGIS